MSVSCTCLMGRGWQRRDWILKVKGSIFLQRDSSVLVITEVLLFLLPKPCCLLGEKPNQSLVLQPSVLSAIFSQSLSSLPPFDAA